MILHFIVLGVELVCLCTWTFLHSRHTLLHTVIGPTNVSQFGNGSGCILVQPPSHNDIPRSSPSEFENSSEYTRVHVPLHTDIPRIPLSEFENASGCTLPPVVVVGCGHSGTSILHLLLSSHPDAYGLLREDSNESGEFLTDNVHKIARSSKRFSAECGKAGKRWWVEKTPSNIHHLEAIMRAIPQVRVVVIYRNGYDVAKSIQKRYCSEKCHEEKSLLHGVHRWEQDNKAALHHLGNPRVHFIQYEALTLRPKVELHGLCTFLDIPYEPTAMLSLHAVKYLITNKTSSLNSKGPLNHYQLRLQQLQKPLRNSVPLHLTTKEQKIVRSIASSTLTFFGYEYLGGAMEKISSRTITQRVVSQ
jgi:hypothetical protein